MFSAARLHTLYRVLNTPIRTYPFPHILVEDAFPAAFYAELQRRLLPDTCYRPLVETGRVNTGYSPGRLCLFPQDVSTLDTSDDNKAFWSDLFATYSDVKFVDAWLKLFQGPVQSRIASGSVPEVNKGHVSVGSEIFLMRDLTNYMLGPHTDSPKKVISVIFYLPQDDSQIELGTSLYEPKAKDFTNASGPFEDFNVITTMPYKPNTIFAFPKTPACYHGVEPVRGTSQRRDLMLFDIKFAG